jgi:hypothetical protein
VPEDDFALPTCFDFAWEESVCRRHKAQNLGPQGLQEMSKQFPVTIGHRNRSNNLDSMGCFFVTLMCIDAMYHHGIYAYHDGDLCLPPPHYEPSNIWRFEMNDGGYFQGIETEYAREMRRRTSSSDISRGPWRRGYRAEIHQTQAGHSLAQVRLRETDLVQNRLRPSQKRVRSSSRKYRPWITAEWRRRSARPISLVTFEREENGDRIAVFNEDFRTSPCAWMAG